MKIRYYVCGLGYDNNDCITDYEMHLGDFDNYEEAYEFFVKLQCRNPKWFFRNTSDVYQLLLQLEECEETGGEINCIDVKNEWRVENPNFEVLIYDRSNIESWRELCEVCTPQECANMFGKPVRDEDKIYYPEEEN